MGYAHSDKRYVPAKLTRFVGAGVALHQNFERWRRWEIMDKRVSVEPMGKRTHIECPSCDGSKGITRGVWHYTFCPMLPSEHSHEYPIEWVNPNPEMDALAELREEGYDETFE